MSSTPQETWDRYYADISSRRNAEASALWSAMSADGVTSETVLALDFVHFSQDEDSASELMQQLSENYDSILSKSDDYWLVSSTTRPHGIDLDSNLHSGWVEFMCDVGQSHGCVFSTWTLESPELKKKWSSEQHEE